jgi:lipid-A-disaccharide synthase
MVKDKQPTHIFICAGEASGDHLGADLAKNLLQDYPHAHITGMGGEQMQAAGVELITHMSQISIMGILEVFTHLKKILRIKKQIKKHIQKNKPQLVVLIDFSGFNLRLTKTAKKSGARILYYVSPTVWAWRTGRIKTIKKYVDHMAVFYPFEKALYQKNDIPVTQVKHPIINKAIPTLSKQAVYQQFNLDPSKPIIGIFAGSRLQEIKMMLTTLDQSCQKIRGHLPDAQFVLALANNLNADEIKRLLKNDIKIISNHNYDLLQVMDAAIAVSGTITLEIALFAVPMVIIYKTTWINYWIVKTLVSITHIGLCNIIAEKTIAKELIQSNVTPNNITNEMIKLLNDTHYRNNMSEQCQLLRNNLNPSQETNNVTQIANQLLVK